MFRRTAAVPCRTGGGRWPRRSRPPGPYWQAGTERWIDPAALVTGEAGLGGLDAAFASLRRPEEHIEVLIRPGLAGAGVGVSSV
ncbi:hypothetical protein [Streptomyces virginiae]|uniref:hypothetical protein n=1 Tax=Streptomyces virginiae TaxID=1961 RepID=UPI00324952A6